MVSRGSAPDVSAETFRPAGRFGQHLLNIYCVHFSFAKCFLNTCYVQSFAEHWGRGVSGVGEEGALEGRGCSEEGAPQGRE